MTTKLTATQTAVLDLFATEEALALDAIAQRLDRKPSALTSTLTALAKRGLISRLAPNTDGIVIYVPVEAPATLPYDAVNGDNGIEPAEPATPTDEPQHILQPVERAALAVSAERRDAGRELELTTSGYARTVSVKVDDATAYVTLDGAYIVTKSGDDHKHPWALFAARVDTVKLIGHFRSSDAALYPANFIL